MKKFFTLLLTVLLVLATSITAYAENETTGLTNVTYNVGTSYTVTIPSEVNITNGTGTQEVKVNANSLIPVDKNIEFKISGSTNYDEDLGFRLLTNGGTISSILYSIACSDGSNVDEPGATILTANAVEANMGKKVTLTYSTDTVNVAGNYSDTLTFSIGII